MFRKKVPPQVKVVLSVDDRRKFASFFALLIAIDRRENKRKASAVAKAMADRSEKKSKPAGQKHDGLGPHIDPLRRFLR